MGGCVVAVHHNHLHMICLRHLVYHNEDCLKNRCGGRLNYTLVAIATRDVFFFLATAANEIKLSHGESAKGRPPQSADSRGARQAKGARERGREQLTRAAQKSEASGSRADEQTLERRIAVRSRAVAQRATAITSKKTRALVSSQYLST